MSENKACPICGNSSGWQGLDALNSKELYDCTICGRYTVTNFALPVIRSLSSVDKGLLSGVIRGRSASGQSVELWEKDISPILSTAPSDLMERLDGLLANLARMTTHFGQDIEFSLENSNLGFTLNQVEFRAQVSHLMDQGLIKSSQRDGQGGKRVVQLTAAGLNKTRVLRKATGVDSNKVFVAMSFSPAMDDVYSTGIVLGIEACGFEPLRVDKIEHNELIDDKIIVGLKECRFVVAEYTGHRNGVYYEVGFAHGMGKTVIMCCHNNDKENIHFDNNHRNFILYNSPEELAEKLKLRILATVGNGVYYPRN